MISRVKCIKCGKTINVPPFMTSAVLRVNKLAKGFKTAFICDECDK